MNFALTVVLLGASMVASSMSMATRGVHQECQSHSDCPSNKPSCYYSKCMNPCRDGAVCGVNANCELRGHIPVCSCPRNMTGDPFDHCRPITDDEQCNPNPCGVNAICRPGHDSRGNILPICSCPFGYSGNALVRCSVDH